MKVSISSNYYYKQLDKKIPSDGFFIKLFPEIYIGKEWKYEDESYTNKKLTYVYIGIKFLAWSLNFEFVKR